MSFSKVLLAASLSFMFATESRAQNITHAPRIDTAPIGTPLTGQVVRLVDGDTFHLQGEQGRYIIRVWGVNAPERRMPYYNVARDFMGTATANETIRCIVVDIDRYNRMVARCNTPQGDLGEQIVSAGLAIDYRRFSRGAYCNQEAAAQAERRGMWRDAVPQPGARRCP